MQLLCSKLNTSKPISYCLDTFFYTNIEKKKHESLLNWCDDLFKYEYCIVPIFTPGEKIGHWTLLFIDINKKSINYYDSLVFKNKERGNICIDLMKNYLNLKYKNKIYFNDWFSETVSNLPQQNNFIDCGLYMCQYAKSLLYSRDMSQLPNNEISKKNKQEIIKKHRKNMVYELKKQTLLF